MGGESQAEYSPSTEDANRDVLRLAQRFQISSLQDQASRWLVTDLTTGNIFARLLTCEEFGLMEVRNLILQQLIANPEALFVMAKDPDMIRIPAVLQDLIVRILTLLGCEGQKAPLSQQPGKAGRTAGA